MASRQRPIWPQHVTAIEATCILHDAKSTSANVAPTCNCLQTTWWLQPVTKAESSRLPTGNQRIQENVQILRRDHTMTLSPHVTWLHHTQHRNKDIATYTWCKWAHARWDNRNLQLRENKTEPKGNCIVTTTTMHKPTDTWKLCKWLPMTGVLLHHTRTTTTHGGLQEVFWTDLLHGTNMFMDSRVIIRIGRISQTCHLWITKSWIN